MHDFCSFNLPLRKYFFLYFARPSPLPPHKFSNGPSLKLPQMKTQISSNFDSERHVYFNLMVAAIVHFNRNGCSPSLISNWIMLSERHQIPTRKESGKSTLHEQHGETLQILLRLGQSPAVVPCERPAKNLNPALHSASAEILQVNSASGHCTLQVKRRLRNLGTNKCGKSNDQVKLLSKPR